MALGVAITAGAAAALPAAAADANAAGQRVAQFQAPRAVDVGESVTVRGRVSPAGRAQLLIQRKAGSSWKAIATLRTDGRGRFRASLPLTRSATLRAVVRAATGLHGPASRARIVALRRRAEVRVLTDGTERIAGRGLRVRGRVWPGRPGEIVEILGRRAGGAVVVGRAKVGTGGKVETSVQIPSGGIWRLVLVAPGRRGVDVTGQGVSLPMGVFDRNPHGIPRSASRYIVQDLGERRLYYYEDGRLRRVFNVVLGKRSTPTPVGLWRVYSKTAGPRAAFGPLVLWYYRGYGIHGTNQPDLLLEEERYYSLGCTRNTNEHIRWLWPRAPIGTPVRNIP